MTALSKVQGFAAARVRYGGGVWRRVTLVILAVLILAPTFDGPAKLLLFGGTPTFSVRPIAAPAVRTNGRLTWLGGARLSGDDPSFGGFSALTVVGDRFVVLNDGGNVVQFNLGADWHPRLAGVGPLPAGPGLGWEKQDRDSESLTRAPDGRLWVGFERVNAIWRYAPDFARAEGSVRPPAMHDWKMNSGAEAMVRLRDGRFVVLSENSHWPRHTDNAAVVFAGDPLKGPVRGFGFSYRPAPGHEVADAAQLPDGDLIVLERRWLLPLRFRSRLALVRLAALKPGATVRGTELGRIAPPWPTENYEGVAAVREGGATILWLVSDNDQSGWRSSYLVKLRLEQPRPTRPARPRATAGPGR